MAEHLAHNRLVAGSNPAGPIENTQHFAGFFYGYMAERKGSFAMQNSIVIRRINPNPCRAYRNSSQVAFSLAEMWGFWFKPDFGCSFLIYCVWQIFLRFSIWLLGLNSLQASDFKSVALHLIKNIQQRILPPIKINFRFAQILLQHQDQFSGRSARPGFCWHLITFLFIFWIRRC